MTSDGAGHASAAQPEGADADAMAIEIVERETVRTARYAVAGASPSDTRRIWIALHGYGQLAPRFLRHFAQAAPPDTRVVAPEGLSRFYLAPPQSDGAHLRWVGATWLTRESRTTEIRDAHRWLDQVYDEVVGAVRHASGRTPPVGVMAFSQGVATAMRWIAESQSTPAPAAFVAWAGGAAADVDIDAFRARAVRMDVLLVAGDADPFATPERYAATREALLGVAPQLRERRFSGGHTLDADTLADVLHSALPE